MNKENMLIIAAHPDDEVLGCGGTIAKYSSEKNIAIGKASIIDGDTIIISDEKIRFAGIDTPEKNKVGHEFSKQKLREKIGNNIVFCIREPKLDPWGRTVAECFIGYESISSFMVKNGYACDYVKYSKKKYAKEQEYAKSKKLGIWQRKYGTKKSTQSIPKISPN